MKLVKKKGDVEMDSDVLILTDANFDELVYGNDEEDWFIEFYAPWCSACKAL